MPVTYNPDMYAVEKSDNGIIHVKVSNKIGQQIAETLEERPLTNFLILLAETTSGVTDWLDV